MAVHFLLNSMDEPVVAFTFRKAANGLLIRPVSARYMHKKEASAYEKITRSEH